MEAVFENLKKSGNNNVDGLINWMKESKVMDNSKASDDKVRQLFAGVDQKNIDLGKFKEVIQKFAADQNINVGDVMKKLTDSGAKILEKLTTSGTKALKKLFGWKDRNDDAPFHHDPGLEGIPGPASPPQSAEQEPPPAELTQDSDTEEDGGDTENDSSEPMLSTDDQSSETA